MVRGFNYSDENSSGRLAKAIKQAVGDNPVVYICVGSDKFLLDSIGPRVGTRLKERSNGSVIAYGVEGDNVMALNVIKAYRAIKYVHPTSKIIVVDAAKSEEIGTIRLVDGVRPGSGVGKDLGKIGDIGILCTIGQKFLYFCNEEDKYEEFVNTAADTIANAIILAAA